MGRGIQFAFDASMAKASPQKIVRIGTAGWSIPSASKKHFCSEGSHLQRYARVLNCAEINSSFYNEHKPETYRRWAESVPDDFAFSLKLNQHFTHQGKLISDARTLNRIFKAHQELGPKWQALVVQLPGKLEFEDKAADRFFDKLRERFSGSIFCEPRNASWGKMSPQRILQRYRINRVWADPERCRWPKRLKVQTETYLRLHGSPVIYRSSYSKRAIRAFSKLMLEGATQGAWCIFDNTTLGAAIENAFEMKRILSDV